MCSNKAIVGGFWIFAGGFVYSLLSFLFWVLLGRFVGLEALGAVSAIVSGVSVVLALISSGLGIATLREVADLGSSGFISSVVSALMLSAISIPLDLLVVKVLGVTRFVWFAILLAFLSLLNTVFSQSLIGLGLFKRYCVVNVISAILRILSALILAFLGFNVVAVMVGYLIYPSIFILLSLPILLSNFPSLRHKIGFHNISRFLKFVFSNYPNVFSNRFVIFSNVFVFASLFGSFASTGVLYVLFMTVLVILSVFGSLYSAALSLSIRVESDAFSNVFRVGLFIASPIICFLSLFGGWLFSYIDPAFSLYVNDLRLLLCSIAPLAYISLIIFVLNRIGSVKRIFMIGFVRVLSLLCLLPILVRFWGALGAVVSFIASCVLALPLSYVYDGRGLFRYLVYGWFIHVLLCVVPWLFGVNAVTVISCFAMSIVLPRVFGLATFGELLSYLKLILRSFVGS